MSAVEPSKLAMELGKLLMLPDKTIWVSSEGIAHAIDESGLLPQWVSVEHRYPIERGQFSKDEHLAWLIYDGAHIERTTIHPGWWNSGDDNITVTHWQPLPLAPTPPGGDDV